MAIEDYKDNMSPKEFFDLQVDDDVIQVEYFSDEEVEVVIDVLALIENYILTSTDISELNDIRMIVTKQISKLRDELQNLGRASEWDVLGDK